MNRARETSTHILMSNSVVKGEELIHTIFLGKIYTGKYKGLGL